MDDRRTERSILVEKSVILSNIFQTVWGSVAHIISVENHKSIKPYTEVSLI